MRLPNGYGSVYKLSGKRRKPWIVVISHGINAEGKVDREPIGYYRTRQEALDALAIYHREPQYIRHLRLLHRCLLAHKPFCYNQKMIYLLNYNLG